MGNYKLKKEGGLIPNAEPKDIVCRYERINTNVFETENDGTAYVADKIAAAIKAKESTGEAFVLGITSGSSPLGVYTKLADDNVCICKGALLRLELLYSIIDNGRNTPLSLLPYTTHCTRP